MLLMWCQNNFKLSALEASKSHVISECHLILFDAVLNAFDNLLL